MIARKDITENSAEKPVLRAGLYLVATPIGNLRDITLRALEALRAADVILCEDTRVTRKLLSAYQIKTKTQSYHDHSEAGMQDKVLGWIEAGRAIALVSDAGMPMINDPGYRLVQGACERGLYVTSLPGANAPLAAMQLSGLPSDKFCFLGFLPNKTKARQVLLKEWMNAPATLIAFETAPRLSASLRDIAQVLGPRMVAVVREITKMFEEVRRGTPEELVLYYEKNGPPKGEIVLVIAPPVPEETNEDDIENLLRLALKTMKTKDAAAHVAEVTGLSKSDLYKRLLGITKNDV